MMPDPALTAMELIVSRSSGAEDMLVVADELAPQTLVWVLAAVTIIFVSARTYVRLSSWRRLYADDCCVYFGLLLLVVMRFASATRNVSLRCLALTCAASFMYTWAVPIVYLLFDVLGGKAQPGPDFEGRVSTYLRLQFALIILFWTTLWSVKISFLIFLKSIFSGISGWIHHVSLRQASWPCPTTQAP